ncbi:hypothetical protein BDD12DRAFT_513309 [Trichophaea hybrida]|nr:hypothetical protein BDD12DRAFT_513309 [Trichophaea hybrida]
MPFNSFRPPICPAGLGHVINLHFPQPPPYHMPPIDQSPLSFFASLGNKTIPARYPPPRNIKNHECKQRACCSSMYASSRYHCCIWKRLTLDFNIRSPVYNTCLRSETMFPRCYTLYPWTYAGLTLRHTAWLKNHHLTPRLAGSVKALAPPNLPSLPRQPLVIRTIYTLHCMPTVAVDASRKEANDEYIRCKVREFERSEVGSPSFKRVWGGADGCAQHIINNLQKPYPYIVDPTLVLQTAHRRAFQSP